MRGALLVLLLAADAGAQSLHSLTIAPDPVRVHVGERVVATAIGHFGGFSTGFHWKMPFESTNFAIATATGAMDWPDTSADIYVTGRAPGIAYIVSSYIGYGEFPLASIEVTCAEEAPITPAAAQLKTEPHRAVTLRLTGPPLPGQSFQWFRGRAGDTSHPLPGADAQLAFAPEDFGTVYVWALSRSTCSTSMAEFRIDAPAPRRRPVSRF